MSAAAPGRHRAAPPARAANSRWIAMASTTGASLVAAGVAFVVNILMARQLGPSSRGDVAFVLQAGYVLAPVLALGVDREALRGTSATGGAPRQGHVWILAGLLSIVALALQSLPLLACVSMGATAAYVGIERGAGMARRSLLRFVGLSLLLQTWILVGALILFVDDVDDVTWWLLLYLAPAPFYLVLDLVRRARHPSGTVGPSRRSLVYMTGGLATLLAGRIERLLLPILSSSRELGLYMVVATTSEMMVWAARGLGESRVQDFVGHQVARRRLARTAVRDGLVFLAAAVPIGALLFLVVIPLVGPSFDEARTLVVPLCLTSVVWCVYLQLSSRWLGAGRSGHSLALDASTTALTGALVVVLVPRYDALGAALACGIAYSIMCVAAVVLFPRSQAASAVPPTT